MSTIEMVDSNETRMDTLVSQVFPLLGLMLGITAIVSYYLTEYTTVPSQIESLGLVPFLGLFILMIVILVFTFIVSEISPINIIGMSLFAGLEGVLLSPIINQFVQSGQGDVVMYAFGATAGVFFVFSLIGIVVDINVNKWSTPLFFALIGVFALYILRSFLGLSGLLDTLLSFGFILFWGVFIVYDINKLDEDWSNPVTVAISLYLDFILIFFEILRLMNGDS